MLLPSSSRPPPRKRNRVVDLIVLAFASLTVCAISISWYLTTRLSLPETEPSPSLRTGAPAAIRLPPVLEEPTESMSDLRRRLPPNVWSRRQEPDADLVEHVRASLDASTQQKIAQLCGTFWASSLVRAVQVRQDGKTFVATGDIDQMWTRDSAVQMGLYVSRIDQWPQLRHIVEGAIRQQAFYLLHEPYANSYFRNWTDTRAMTPFHRSKNRGGYVATYNYELDSGAYFLTQLYDYYVSPALYKPEVLLEDPLIFEAVRLLVRVWTTEQNHESDSPYRYRELKRDGRGLPTKYTGLTWSGFRPSDDPCLLHYLVPANMFAAAALERVLVMNERIWKSETLHTDASKLLDTIQQGIRDYGVVPSPEDGKPIYAYEVDGLGNAVTNYDDANFPNLLSAPLLGWSQLDMEIYERTRERVLNPKLNSHYFVGQVFRGQGSTHTFPRFVWPMSFAVEALTSTPSQRKESMLFQVKQSLTATCNDAAHESVNSAKGCSGAGGFSRAWFEWANAMFVVLMETAMGLSCDEIGMAESRVSTMLQTAKDDKQYAAFNNSMYYRGLEGWIQYMN